MKILLLHSYYQHSGGEEVVFHKERDYLTKTETVETLTFKNKSGFKGAFQFLMSIWNFIEARKLKKTINNFQPDVIHIHNWHFGIGPIAIRIANRKKIPIALTLHNHRLLCPSAILLNKGDIFIDSINSSFPWKAVFKRVYRNSVLQTFWLAFIIWFHKKIGTWNMVDKYIAVADFSKEFFVNSSLGVQADKFVVKPNFSAESELLEGERGNHFLFIGRLSKEKGIHLMLEAFNQTNFELHIGGNGPLLDFVEKNCAENKNLKYLGYLDKKQVQEAMNNCTALIFPSICYEMMPLAVIEAFAMGKPIIATKLGVLDKMIQHEFNGLQFELNNATDLKMKLEFWQAMSESKKEKYKQNVLSVYNSKYTPEKVMQQLMNIYKSIQRKSD